jgi:transposase
MGMEKEKKLSRQRVLVILRVRGGEMTTREGARRLGVSRKTYYEWEERALRAMALALENRPLGRPPLLRDQEKEELRERIKELEKKLTLAEKTIEVKEMLSAYEKFRAGKAKKKERNKNGKSDKRR